MKIEEIKALCASKVHADDDYFDVSDYRKALLVAITALEQSSGFWMANRDCLKEIEEIFN